MKSLVIFHLDDDILVLDRFKRIIDKGLQNDRYTLKQFENINDFEQAIKTQSDVTLFILDIQLNHGNRTGVEMTSICRETFPNSLILMCSNTKDIRQIHSSLILGANDFLPKDASSEQIIEQIRFILQEHLNLNQINLPSDLTYAGKTIASINARIPNIIQSAVNCVFIAGESGTGKEIVASCIESQRPKNTPFIKLNCGTIPSSLIASELFGHAKGSFTGASHDKVGLIESAHNGWIFLDEVATLPIDAQISLLRAIDNQTIRRVGSNTERTVSFRVISATNENIPQMIADGKFRNDLWQRLKEIQIDLPPLRERRSEISELIDFFCKTMRGGPYKIETHVKYILEQYSWGEGNIRELRNCLRAMTERSIHQTLTMRTIPEFIWQAIETTRTAPQNSGAPHCISISWNESTRPNFETLSYLLLAEILKQEFLEHGQMSVRAASKATGIAKSSMRSKLLKLVSPNILSSSELNMMVNLSIESD
jgi:DNA-binding NtrC family response regulator